MRRRADTKLIRIAVGVDEFGNWNATGAGYEDDDDPTRALSDGWHRRAVSDGLQGNTRCLWVEVRVPLPSRSRPIIKGQEAEEVADVD